MMPSFSAEIDVGDGVEKLLRTLGAIDSEDERKDLHLAMAGKLQSQLRRHFLSRKNEGNKLGGKSTRFWAKIAKATSVNVEQTTADRGVVTVADRRFNVHYFGATIRPREAKALTIPVRAEAHGLRAKELADKLGVKLFRPGGRPLLAAKVGGKLRVFYVLRKSVTIPKDPNATPAKAAIEKGLLATAQSHFNRRIAQN